MIYSFMRYGCLIGIALNLFTISAEASQPNPPTPSRKIYSVDVEATLDKRFAEKKRNSLREAGYQTVSIVQSGDRHKVRVGELASHPEGIELQRVLRSEGYDGIIVSIENTKGVIPQGLEVRYDPFLKARCQMRPFNVRSERRVADFESGIIRSLISTGGDILPDNVSALQGELPDNLRLIFLALVNERQGDKGQSLIDVLRAYHLSGDVSLEIHRDALLHYADAVHYSARDFAGAYLTYSYLLRNGEWSDWDKTELVIQKAASLLELMDSYKGHPEDVRAEYRQLRHELPKTSKWGHLMLDLLQSETYAWQKDFYDQGIADSMALANRASAYPHIQAQALWNASVLLGRLNRNEEGLRLMEQIAFMDIPVELTFRSRLMPKMCVPRKAMEIMAAQYARHNNTNGATQMRNRYNQLAVSQPLTGNQIPGHLHKDGR